MFTYLRTIYLRETDATGVLFFSQQFTLALEALETFFLNQGFSLREMIEEKDFFMPIVHAEANFMQPLYVGDRIEIRLELEAIGQSSFTISSRFFHSEKEIEMGNTKIIHVTISKKTKKSILIPEKIRELLQNLSLEGSSMKNEDFRDFIR